MNFPAIAFTCGGEIDKYLILRVEPDGFPD
jgi:hypothetical protein